MLPAGESERHTSEVQPKPPEKYLEQITLFERRISELERQVAILMKPEQPQDDLWKQSEANIRALESIFNIDADDTVDTRELDGLLSDCVDEDENSMELVRSIHGGLVFQFKSGQYRVVCEF